MNTALKTRLVGAAVLLILSGLLWPILFDFDESLQIPHQTVEVPEQPSSVAEPTIRSAPVELDNPSQKVSEADTLADVVVADVVVADVVEEKSLVVDENQPQLDNNHIPVSYVVQTGTFSRWSNAVALRDKLVKAHLKAYLRPETSVQKGPYVVAVGPYLTQAQAREAQNRIKREFNMQDAIVRRF